jgi:hypothetical protein
MNFRYTAALALIACLLLPLPLAAEGPVAVPGTADAEMAPSSSPLVVRGTADTPPNYDNELSLRVDLARQKYKLLLEKIHLTESREGGPDGRGHKLLPRLLHPIRRIRKNS